MGLNFADFSQITVTKITSVLMWVTAMMPFRMGCTNSMG